MHTVDVDRIPTLEDVAKRAGVSTATVSRCFNNSGVVHPQTRERVELAISDLGYTPNFGARALASNRTGTIGVVIPTMENAIFAQGLQAMEETLSKQDVTLLVATSGYSAEQEYVKIRAMVARGVDGLGLIGFKRSQQVYDFLSARSMPFVLLWNYSEISPHPCIGFDNHEAAAAMARRVVELGHRHIAMIAGRSEGNDRAAGRITGVIGTLSAQGLELVGGAPIECDYSFEAGEAAANDLLSGPTPPTAIICGNDVLAVGAMRGARHMGLTVPNDVSVVGFDDIDLAQAVDPPLTTIHAPHRRMGRAAARMLLSFSDLEAADARISFSTEIIERGSLAPAGKPQKRR